MALQLNISFKLTAHAKKRIYQRNITPPNADTYKHARKPHNLLAQLPTPQQDLYW